MPTLAVRALGQPIPVERIQRILDAIDAPQDMLPATIFHWYAMVLEFKPDVILELGRGYGNSTAVLTEAANQIGATVKSFDLNPGWLRKGSLEGLVDPAWFEALELLHGDLTGEDFGRHIGDRTLIVWDAHGFDIAETVLGRILPLIAAKPHLVMCHDIADNRFAFTERQYRGPLWRGMDDYYHTLATEPRSFFNLGHFCGAVDQVIPILDFCWRNEIELHSADQEIRGMAAPFAQPVSWAYFTLNECHGAFRFPPMAKTFDSELHRIRNSFSWRITAPLRAVRRLAGRILG
jgi:SAM-dependent methyltransferase